MPLAQAPPVLGLDHAKYFVVAGNGSVSVRD